ncbi:MAG: hypothetical protein ABIH92_04660 [Nanoarchaeota archaeon]
MINWRGYDMHQYARFLVIFDLLIRTDFSHPEIDIDSKREILRTADIQNLRSFGAGGVSINSRHCERWVIGKRAMQIAPRMLDYLMFYQPNFQEDKESGKTREIHCGKQLEFEVTGQINKVCLGDGRLRRDEIAYERH